MHYGFTGRFAAGKTEACKYLESRGFNFHSLSDILREEMKRRGKEESRRDMIALGNELREKHGPGVLAEKTVEKIRSEGGKFAIDSIRNPYEAEALKELDDFLLVGIQAPIEQRFQRIEERDRKGDPESLEELKEMEASENTDVETNQQLDATFEKADVIINNDGTLQEFKNNLDKLVERHG